MSQICKFYLQDGCKYGQKCHFRHEDPYYADYSNDRRPSQKNYYRNERYSQNQSYSHHNSYAQQNYEKDYSQNYSRSNTQNYHANSRSNYRDNTYAGKQNYNRYGGSNDAAQQNYDRFHVDHRQNRRKPIDSETLSLEDFLEIVNMTLTDHHRSQAWPFTVIAPVENFGNIPGLRDLSPEEVHYQYVESMADNTLHDFDRNMNNALNELKEFRLMFQSKSSQARNIITTMMEGLKSTETNNVTNNFSTPATSAFSFDLSKLKTNQSLVSDEDMNTDSGPSSSSNLFQNINPFNQQENAQGFPRSGTDHHSFKGNQASTFSFANLPRQSDSQINTFSFSISNIKSSHENPIQSGGFHCQPVSASNVNDSIYSDLGQLTAESIQQFQAKIFKPGKIPLCPPPQELCIS